MEKQNPFSTQLEEALKTFKDGLVKQEESTKTAYDSAVISNDSYTSDLGEASKNVEKTSAYYLELYNINIQALQASLIGKNALGLSGVASTDYASVVQNIAKAARSIEVASQSIAQLYSDAAAMQAKVGSEDSNTEISQLAGHAKNDAEQAAIAAEQTTVVSLDATISAAQSSMNSVQTAVKTLSGDMDALYAAINTTAQAAKELVDKADAGYITAMTNEKNSELTRATTEIDYLTAQQVNGPDKEKIGLIAQAAKEERKEEKRQAATTNANRK